jgi:hypothetical protein
VSTLREFALRGHQILMFTCHEHIARLCKSNRLDVRRLPENKQGGSDRPFEFENESSPRRSRSRRIKEEVAFVPDAVAASPPQSSKQPIDTTDTYQMQTSSVTKLRIDRAQRVAKPSPIMRRWSAEEFSGELDDQVNPIWLLNETAPDDASFASPAPRAPIHLAIDSAADLTPILQSDNGEKRELNTASKTVALRLMAAEPTEIIVEEEPGEEGRDL